MTIQIENYIRSLAVEYLTLCETMTSHHYHSEDERAALSAQRTWTHNELIRLLGDEYQRPFDMKAYCRTLVENS
jgi:hypothetical protein